MITKSSKFLVDTLYKFRLVQIIIIIYVNIPFSSHLSYIFVLFMFSLKFVESLSNEIQLNLRIITIASSFFHVNGIFLSKLFFESINEFSPIIEFTTDVTSRISTLGTFPSNFLTIFKTEFFRIVIFIMSTVICLVFQKKFKKYELKKTSRLPILFSAHSI